MEVNYAAIPLRPAGAAWSNIKDMLRYVQMELDEGMVDGKRFVSADALLARRAPQVNVSKDETYGMGLMVDKTWGIAVVHHGGDLLGYHSDMMWIPDAKVGAVVLTNADAGVIIRTQFRRKLLEVLYDGQALADANVASTAEAINAQRVAERKQLVIPPDADAAGKLAKGYANAALGEIRVTKGAKEVVFDVGEWKSPVASKKNPDGTTSFVTVRPGLLGFQLVAGEDKEKGKRTLTVRDGQHDYVFVEK
jgi:CubicO group peptidase (beta-lactamase class C family)